MGLVIFLLFSFIAVQILVHLYATSLVSGAAHDAAASVAAYEVRDHRASVIGLAEEELRQALGSFGESVAVTWETVGPDVVTVRITGRTPTLLPGFVGSSLLGIDERVSVRVEDFVAPAR